MNVVLNDGKGVAGVEFNGNSLIEKPEFNECNNSESSCVCV